MDMCRLTLMLLTVSIAMAHAAEGRKSGRIAWPVSAMGGQPVSLSTVGKPSRRMKNSDMAY